MSEENQTPQPKWMTELKKWGIDVEAFDAQWDEAGDNAKAQFQQALTNAKAEYESGKSELEEEMDEMREDVEEFLQQMNTSWNKMVASLQEQLNPPAEDTDSSE